MYIATRPQQRAPPLSKPARVLLIQLRRLGDVVLSTALLEDLHRAWPGVSVDWLVGPEAAPLLEHHPLVAERLVLEPGRTLATARALRARGYDRAIDVQGSGRTGFLARATGAPVRVGWRTGAWRAFYTRALPRGATTEYVVGERERLLELAGVPLAPAPARPQLVLTDEERALGERDAREAGAPAAGPRVGLLLSTREPAKDWPAAHFAALAVSLAARGVVPLAFQGPGDEARAAAVRDAMPGAVLVAPLPLRRFLGVLAGCRAFVSGDTGPAHMADALGVPRATIFGPTHPVQWCPTLPTTVALTGPGARVVPLRHRARELAAGHDFTGGVTPDVVLGAVQRLLDSGDG